MRVLVTGSPGAGKTTLLSAPFPGFRLVPDLSRVVIERDGLHPLANHEAFQQQWFGRMFNAYNQATGSTIFEYGLPDVLVYYRWREGPGYEVAKHMTDAIKSKRYDMVAIVDPIPSEYYSRDTARTMPYEDALTIHAITVRIYAEWGYTPAHVPFMEVAERQNYLASLIR